MTELQQVLLMLTSISHHLIASQFLISDICAKEAQGISPATRRIEDQGDFPVVT
jgi:hypothetical protein